MDPKSDDYRDRHLVLSCLALFKRFGWGQPVRAGAYEIFDNVVTKLDAGMSRAKFGVIIDEMYARKVLEGDNFLYITPRAPRQALDRLVGTVQRRGRREPSGLQIVANHAPVVHRDD
jgi:hypothetical protein